MADSTDREVTEALGQLVAIDVLAFGRFGRDQLRIDWTDEPRPTTATIEQAIERTWPEQLEKARQEGRVLFNGPMARHIDHNLAAGSLRVTAGPTCYRDFVGTNLFNPQLLDQAGWACFSNPIGTTATILTADGYLLYGRRNNKVAFHGGYLHTFGGAIEPGDTGAAGQLDGFGSILRELREELRLDAAECTEIVCVGLIRDQQIWQPEMLFEARCRLSQSEILERLDLAHDEEHCRIEGCVDRPEDLMRFPAGARPIAPVAIGSMLLHGWHQWGRAWVLEAAHQIGLWTEDVRKCGKDHKKS